MSSEQFIDEMMEADLTSTGKTHKKGHGSGEPYLTDRQRDEALAKSKIPIQVAAAHDRPSRGASGPIESKHRGAERELDGMNGRAENDIIRVLWDSYQPDQNDELSIKRLDDVMNDFGLWGTGGTGSDLFIADLLKHSGRPKIDCASFMHWWSDHGKAKACHNRSVWWVMDRLRQFFNSRIDIEHAKHSTGAARKAAEGCAVAVESLADVLVSPQWASLLEQETKGEHHGRGEQPTAGAHMKASLATPEWARETAVKVLDRIGLASAPSATYSLMELWWAFATHKRSLLLLMPSMHTPSPDLAPDHRRHH